MLKKLFLMTCALALCFTPVLAQDEPPPEGPPPGPHLMIPLPPDTELPPPPPEGTPEEFLDVAIGAIDGDGDGLLSADEIHAAHQAAHGDMPPPPPEGDEPPPPPEGPPPGPHIFIPLPPDTELPPPPPDGTPEEFLAAAIAAIDGDGDGKLSKEEIMAAHEAAPGEPPPEEPPPEEPPPEEPPPEEPPPEEPMPGEMMPHLMIPLPEGFMPPEDGSGFIEAAFAAIDGGDGELTLEELIALLPPPPEGDEPPPPPEEMPPHLMIPLPEDFVPPPPEDGPEAFIGAAFALIAGEDGILTLEELLEWLDKFAPMHGDSGISEGDEGLEGLPAPPECSDAVRDSELLPQAENVSCDRSESVGNLIFRTVCNAAPYNTNAISLPEARAADCFGIEAIKGHNIVFEIVEEAGGTVVFDTSMGKTAFDTLVLTGGPGGTVYQIKLVSADEADARITIRFIDHPTF